MTKRMGLHVHSGDGDDLVRAYIDRCQPSVMKWLDDAGSSPTVGYARQRGALTVLRVYTDRQALGAEGGRYIRRVVAAMRQWPDFMVAEGYNEEFQEPKEAVARAAFDIELMQAMDGIGRKAAIYSVSTGQPEMAFWRDYMPALRYAAEHGHYVAVHEYGGGPLGLKWGVGANQHPWNGQVDECERAGIEGWWCFRYRRSVAEWRQLGLTTIPGIVVTEGGLDDIWPRPEGAGKGYRDFVGKHPAGVGDYAAQLSWYYRRASEDSYFVGGVDFGWKTRDRRWDSFDLSQDPVTLERVMVEMERLRQVVPTPTPPLPTPAPVQGLDPFVAVEVLRGEGKLSVIRRAYGLPLTAPMATLRAKLAELEAANPGRSWGPGAWLRVPGREIH